MASGCIFGTCWVCDELVWEDEAEYDFDKDLIIHKKCLLHAKPYTEELKMLRKELYKARIKIKKLESEGLK